MQKFLPLCLVAALYSAPAIAEEVGWTVSEASPGVTILHAGRSLVAQRNGRVVAGDVVITASNSRAVLVRGEEYAMVAPNSRLQIAQTTGPDGFTQLLERFGNAIFSVRKGTKPHFSVQTPYLAAVVKGTTFSVTVDESGASVQVVEGAVEVSSTDGRARYLAHPGDIASIAADSRDALTVQGSHRQVIRATAAKPSLVQAATTPAKAAGPTAPASGTTDPSTPATSGETAGTSAGTGDSSLLRTCRVASKATLDC